MLRRHGQNSLSCSPRSLGHTLLGLFSYVITVCPPTCSDLFSKQHITVVCMLAVDLRSCNVLLYSLRPLEKLLPAVCSLDYLLRCIEILASYTYFLHLGKRHGVVHDTLLYTGFGLVCPGGECGTVWYKKSSVKEFKVSVRQTCLLPLHGISPPPYKRREGS